MENSTFKDTYTKDYVDLIHSEFPDISKQDIKLIIDYGWRLIYIACMFGCPVLIQSQKYKFWFYIGQLFKDSLKHFNYYRRKLIQKIAFLYKRTKQTSDYYYVALNKEEYDKFFKKKGRKRKKFDLTNKMIFQSQDACEIYYFNCICILKFSYIDVGFRYYKKNITITNPEIVLMKNPSTFEDILVMNNDYKLI